LPCPRATNDLALDRQVGFLTKRDTDNRVPVPPFERALILPLFRRSSPSDAYYTVDTRDDSAPLAVTDLAAKNGGRVLTTGDNVRVGGDGGAVFEVTLV